MRAVLDVNVLVSALLSPHGAPARLVTHWLSGAFELVVSEALLAELERALAYPKVRKHVAPEEATQFVSLLRTAAIAADDPPEPPRRSPDPGDDYVLALAEEMHAVVVSGDRDLRGLAQQFPVLSAADFLAEVDG